MRLLLKQRYHNGIINREDSKIRHLEFNIVSVIMQRHMTSD